MKKNVISQSFAFLAVVLMPAALTAQIMLERQVIGSGGNFSIDAVNNINITSTVGEVVVPTFSTTNFVLTQGFNQPDVMLLPELNFSDQHIQTICPDKRNGRIIVNNMTGCLAPYEVILKRYESNGFVTIKTFPNVAENYEVSFDSLGVDTFVVEVIGAAFCSKSDTFFLDAKNPENCNLRAYNGITPNGDGVNDSWIIDNIELSPVNEVSIINRWGNVVWDAKNYNNNDIVWRGENKNGKELPDATYFYVIKTSDETTTGWVEVTR